MYFKTLVGWLWKERRGIQRVYLMAALQSLLYIGLPLCIQGVITYTMAGHFSASLVLLSMVAVIFIALISVFKVWQFNLNEYLQEKIFAETAERLAVYEDLSGTRKLKLLQFFEILTLQKGIGKILLDFSVSIVSIGIGLLILPAYSSWFFLLTILLALSFVYILYYYGKRAQQANILLSESKYSILKLLLYDSAPSVHDHYQKLDAELMDYLSFRQQYHGLFLKQLKGLLTYKVIFVGFVLFLGAYLVQIGELNIGQFVASEIIVLFVVNAIEKLVSSIGICYEMITAIIKLNALLPPDNPLQQNAAISLQFNSQKQIYPYPFKRQNRWYWMGGLILLFLILISPWTQTVNVSGSVSVLNPERKPQQITSRIAGRVEKWYIQDGAFVNKNDTIAYITEIKEEYLDPKLVQRSESQITSKETAMESYQGKIRSIDLQIDALNKGLVLKREQLQNKTRQYIAKLASDSVEWIAAQNNLKITKEQLARYDELLDKGIVSKTEHENRKLKFQEALAKSISSENKIIGARNELLNAKIEQSAISQEYNEKLMKLESDKFSTLSMYYDAEGQLTKLQNQLSNYALRQHYYYVLAPQDGYINELTAKGVGEIVKEGGIICKITPKNLEQAVELFVDPVDLPLIAKGQELRLIFDGWPSFYLSGWPGVSNGTFAAEVISFDKVISTKGKFRILARAKGTPWPNSIQIGGGVQGFCLLRNVPLVYELWRIINGFPPEFYITPDAHDKPHT